mgnify:CR=1 FL=1
MKTLKELQDGKTTSRALTKACLARVEALDSSLHAFLHVDESAPERASQVDKESPLAGLPIAVKDILMVEGMPAPCGSKILEGFMPPFTATSVKKLQDAGAVIIGKTNTDEFAMGSSTENSAYGVTHNPWNLDRVPGGSSGGNRPGCIGHRHRRLDPSARILLRDQWHQTDLWTRIPLRVGSLWLFIRFCWYFRAFCR